MGECVIMRGSKKGPHKCFKTLTERLTPKYVCPSKGKGGVTALSTMRVRPEREKELESRGEVRKPPKQAREEGSDPIARLDKKEKERENRHLQRLQNHPQSMHAEESEEATQDKPDTIHFETDEEAEAVKKAFDKAIDDIYHLAIQESLPKPFSSLSKSLSMVTDLNKAEAPKGWEATKNFLESNDIKSGETFKDYFKRHDIDTKSLDKFINKHDKGSAATGASSFTHKGSRDAFFNTPIEKLYNHYSEAIAKKDYSSGDKTKFLAATTKINPVKVALSHYNVMGGNKPYEGSAVKDFNDKLDAGASTLIKPPKIGSSISAARGTPKQEQADKKRAKRLDQKGTIVAAHKKYMPVRQRQSLWTEEGRAQHIKGMKEVGHLATWFLPTSAGIKVLGGGHKVFTGPAIKSLSKITQSLIGPANAGARTKFITALDAVITTAKTTNNPELITTSLNAAAFL